MSISIHQVTKSFGQAKALDNVSLEIPGGELVALLGPSGCGKTTLLRIIAGLETADSGRIDYQGEDMTSVAAGERQVGFVFQHYALFRHMTVFDNIAFGLEVRGRPTEFIRDKVNSLLKLVRLENMGDRYPTQLSGGQRQRIALTRALAIEPKVLLLDEPFGALDAKVRQELRQWLRRLHDELHTTSVFVTHDQEEAFEVSDQVVVMNHGQVEQIGSPFEVFEKPASQFVMDFLGHVNVFRGRLHNGRAVIGGLSLDMPDHPTASVADATLYVRPHELEVERHLNGRPGLKAKVERVNPAGSIAKVGLSSPEQAEEIQVDLSRDRYEDLQLKIGEEVFIVPKRVRVFMPEYVI